MNEYIMQTFITEYNFYLSAKNLDTQRLRKQILEALQIGANLLIERNGWFNHPATQMWIGYEEILVYDYIPLHIAEYESRNGTVDTYIKMLRILREAYVEKNGIPQRPIPPQQTPSWLSSDFIEAHRSNLIDKNYEYYKPKFPDTIENLPYIWPR